ncbi:hypothetical protein Poli38472_010308 [Pythium oligandrum]|uniref:F-box domain-containing protein n=1 Tax=Pythium oligandrum TaxID=41045 RepID=A0A8K1FAU5_PYTOL|nr:hypothetical protein Poli38472_010308 [Pythium oligandrum]|eukprot:TMW55426.1 hypothetical protein Poli38472_010308 [Pythium oligandrum]
MDTSRCIGGDTREIRCNPILRRRLGNKLFIHFVGNGSSHRLDLVTADYVKTHTESVTKSSNRQLSEIGHWVVNEEMLLWRLERSIFPVYENMQTRAHAQIKAAAELGRLPAQLFADLTQFLTAEEFGRLTLSNKHLRGLAPDDKLWQTYIQRDFPHASIANGCPMRDEYLQLQISFHCTIEIVGLDCGLADVRFLGAATSTPMNLSNIQHRMCFRGNQGEINRSDALGLDEQQRDSMATWANASELLLA